jgi:hypothetical protein
MEGFSREARRELCEKERLALCQEKQTEAYDAGCRCGRILDNDTLKNFTVDANSALALELSPVPHVVGS